MNESEFLQRQALAARAGMREAARGLVEDAAAPFEVQRIVRKRPIASVTVAALAGFGLVLLLRAPRGRRSAARAAGLLPRLLGRVAVHGMRILRSFVEAVVVANWPRGDEHAQAEPGPVPPPEPVVGAADADAPGRHPI